jgi:hypothetical protein
MLRPDRPEAKCTNQLDVDIGCKHPFRDCEAAVVAMILVGGGPFAMELLQDVFDGDTADEVDKALVAIDCQVVLPIPVSIEGVGEVGVAMADALADYHVGGACGRAGLLCGCLGLRGRRCLPLPKASGDVTPTLRMPTAEWSND